MRFLLLIAVTICYVTFGIFAMQSDVITHPASWALYGGVYAAIFIYLLTRDD
jgi:uncharacterized membrane protein YdcZ (DUF606 family)